MTYLQFLLIFILPLLLLEMAIFLRARDSAKRLFVVGLLLLSALALAYTFPWDSYLIAKGIWSYSPERVLGSLGYVPYEECAFFLLQTWLSGLWCFFVRHRFVISGLDDRRTWNISGSVFLLLLWVIGLLGLRSDGSLYMSLILCWSLPVIILQWMVGGGHLVSNAKGLFWAAAPPTVYLWAVDAVAIHFGVWRISPVYTTGVKLFNLPIEEALFFLVTNLMIVQGLILLNTMGQKSPARIRRWLLVGGQ